MKNQILTLALALLCITGFSQVKTPQSSPLSKIEQVVGLTDVTINYSRPSVKGRTVFGDLVPFGKPWRLGANENTKISFSTDVVINNTTLKAGEYAIFATPNQTNWDVVFYTDTKNWGVPKVFEDSKIAAKVTAEVHKISEKIETFTISLDDLTNDSAVLGILWENTYVGIKINVPTDVMVTENIDKALKGPSANDYYASAVYYLQSGKNIQQAKTWMDKAIAMAGDKVPFYQLRQQALIYAKAGDKKGAIEIAKKSLAASEAAGNEDYIKMNKASLKEWGVK